ncbi:MAG: DUF692 domain-containing protein [Sphingomonas bacterium]|nr:DUF692 domain-containing protein [Sphingomonas bacterium]
MTITAGLGFKMQHLDEALESRNRGLWFEVHAENYMVDGGPRLAALMALRERFAISVHGVGLSLAAIEPPSPDHLARLRTLIERVEPFAVSDHLAWQKWNGAHHADFLPFPRTHEALDITAANIGRVQDAIGRPIMVENPSLYVDVGGHELSEAAFLSELARRTGCGLLLDVNNLFVSAHNLDFAPEDALDAMPAEAIGEIHLAGHARDSDPDSDLLIDSHGAPVADPVWALYEQAIARIGARPTLLERDDDVPAFAELIDERDRIDAIMANA